MNYGKYMANVYEGNKLIEFFTSDSLEILFDWAKEKIEKGLNVTFCKPRKMKKVGDKWVEE